MQLLFSFDQAIKLFKAEAIDIPRYVKFHLPVLWNKLFIYDTARQMQMTQSQFMQVPQINKISNCIKWCSNYMNICSSL
jgi:hypothetical protein